MKNSPLDKLYPTILEELRVRRREGAFAEKFHIEDAEVTQWASLAGCSVTDFLDQFAIEIAADFFVGFLSWEFADRIANDLHAVMLDLSGKNPEFRWPDECWEFYLAFDHSEIEGSQDRELIRDFLKKHKYLSP